MSVDPGECFLNVMFEAPLLDLAQGPMSVGDFQRTESLADSTFLSLRLPALPVSLNLSFPAYDLVWT